MLTPLFYLFDHSNLYSRLEFICKKKKTPNKDQSLHFLISPLFFYLPFTFTLRWNCGRDSWLWIRPCQNQARGRRRLFHMVWCHKSHAQNIVTCTQEILNIFYMILLIGILYIMMIEIICEGHMEMASRTRLFCTKLTGHDQDCLYRPVLSQVGGIYTCIWAHIDQSNSNIAPLFPFVISIWRIYYSIPSILKHRGGI
jgi:hypothetical protein